MNMTHDGGVIRKEWKCYEEREWEGNEKRKSEKMRESVLFNNARTQEKNGNGMRESVNQRFVLIMFVCKESLHILWVRI